MRITEPKGESHHPSQYGNEAAAYAVDELAFIKTMQSIFYKLIKKGTERIPFTFPRRQTFSQGEGVATHFSEREQQFMRHIKLPKVVPHGRRPTRTNGGERERENE